MERLIARGGMAAVFLAEHIALRRRVALKILHPPPDADESGNFEKRFRLEAETLATLDHPNIVTLYDYGEAEDGRFYLAMEYIEGPRFTDLLGAGALEADRTIRLILEVCAALRYAHKRGVIHRDLKPSNLLIGNDGEGQERVKVVDFGLVKVAEIDQSLTREGLVLGSPHCMAPEQVRGANIDHRADIYAIGVLLFRSLTGVYPFHGATSTSTMVAHLNEPIPTFASVAPDLTVPTRLEDVVRRCLAKRPTDRYPDVKSLMEDLASCIGMRPEPDSRSLSNSLLPGGEPSTPTAPAVAPTLVPEPSRSRSKLPLLALALLLLLSLSGVVYVLGSGDATEGTPPTAAAAPPPVTNGAAVTGAQAPPSPAGPETTVAPAPDATGGASKPTGDAGTRVAPEGTNGDTTVAPAQPPPKTPDAGRKPTREANSGKGKPTGENGGSPSPATGEAVPSAKPTSPEGYMPLPDAFQ